MDLQNHLFKARIGGMTLREKSGFFVRNLNANATIDTTRYCFKILTSKRLTQTLKISLG
jgi:hypothetical protein